MIWSLPDDYILLLQSVQVAETERGIKMEHNDVIEIDLTKLVKALLKKAWIVVLAAALAAVIVGGISFVTHKITYEPKYRAISTMCVKPAYGDETYTSTDATIRIKTYVAVSKTHTVLQEINEELGLNLDYETMSGLFTVRAKNSSEVLEVVATCTSPEEAVLIANKAAEVLEDKAEMIHGENTLVIFENATEAEFIERSSQVLKKAVVAAVLVACLVCACIVAKELYVDWKAAVHKNA